MTDHNNQKTFIATTWLYHLLSKRSQPRFLRRNLRHVFDSCENLLPGATNAQDATAEEERRGRARWKPPTDAMMDEYVESDRPKLTIDSFSLRAPSDGFMVDDATEPAVYSRHNSGPTWLPHPVERPIPCQVIVSIYCKHLAKTQVYYEARSAQIFRSVDVTSPRVFSIRLQSPFVIAADELKITHEELRQDQSIYWERKMSERYSLELGIACPNSSDSAEFLAQLEGSTHSQFLGIPGNEGLIRAVWGDPDNSPASPGLPALPPENALLPMWRVRGGRRLLLPYSLQPNIGWTSKSDDSILATHNKLLRRLRSGQQMPTPPPSEDAEPLLTRRRSGCKVKYQFWSGSLIHRSVHIEDLHCIFCPDDQEHPSIERLYVHYATHHEHFTLAILDDEERDVKIIKMQLHDKPQHYANPRSLDSFNWQAPRDAFDVAAYMLKHSRGQTTGWETEQAEPVAYPEEVPEHGSQKEASTARHGRPLALELGKPRIKDMLPADVPDLPTPDRKKHKVPDVPGVEFRRTLSKQVLLPGEMVSDSDQSQDEYWLVQRQRRDLRNLGLDATTQALHELVDAQLHLERPMSDVLVRDALVRFARRHKAQLANPRMKALFRDKLAILERALIISMTDFDYCCQIIPSAVPDGDVDMDGHSAEGSEMSDPLPCKNLKDAWTARLDVSRANPAQVSAKTSHAALPSQQTPFGRRQLICRRTNGSRQKPFQCEVAELVKHGYDHLKSQDIRPLHLDWFKFTRILDKHLIYLRPSDNIVCLGDRLAPLVTDEKDWYAALGQAEQEPRGDGTLVFELHTAESFQNILVNLHSTRPGDTAAQEGNKVALTRDRRPQPCDCGLQVAAGTRGTTGCDNWMCSRNYHMACVGLNKRVIGWKCPNCV